MQDQGFQSIDQTTQQTLKQQQLQKALNKMTARCLELSESLNKQKQHMSQISQISTFFDQKLNQMSQLLIDFLALQNYIMKQVDMIEQVGSGIKQVKDDIVRQKSQIKIIQDEIRKGNKILIEELEKQRNDQNRIKEEKYEEIIRSKDEEIKTLKLASQRAAEKKEEQTNMLDLILKKMTVMENGMSEIKSQKGSESNKNSEIKALEKKCAEYQEQIQRLNQQLGSNHFGLGYKPQKPKKEIKQDYNNYYQTNPFNRKSNANSYMIPSSHGLNNFDKYPKSKPDLNITDSNKLGLNQIEKCFFVSIQNVNNVITKSSNQLISQLSQRDSLQKMTFDEQETRMTLEQIRKKLSKIEASSKKSIENLITQMKQSIKKMISQHYPFVISKP